MKKTFLSEFFSILGGTAIQMGEAFTFDFYLHRGRKYNLYWPDDHKRFRKGVYNLKRSGYIRSAKDNSFKFTKKGREWYKKNVFKYMPFRENVWDGKWRVVFFDIPEKFHNKRDVFRQRLKNLGFHQLQKSLLVMPFKYEEDVARMCSKLKISDYVDVLVANSIGSREKELKKIFSLQQ